MTLASTQSATLVADRRPPFPVPRTSRSTDVRGTGQLARCLGRLEQLDGELVAPRLFGRRRTDGDSECDHEPPDARGSGRLKLTESPVFAHPFRDLRHGWCEGLTKSLSINADRHVGAPPASMNLRCGLGQPGAATAPKVVAHTVRRIVLGAMAWPGTRSTSAEILRTAVSWTASDVAGHRKHGHVAPPGHFYPKPTAVCYGPAQETLNRLTHLIGCAAQNCRSSVKITLGYVLTVLCLPWSSSCTINTYVWSSVGGRQTSTETLKSSSVVVSGASSVVGHPAHDGACALRLGEGVAGLARAETCCLAAVDEVVDDGKGDGTTGGSPAANNAVAAGAIAAMIAVMTAAAAVIAAATTTESFRSVVGAGRPVRVHIRQSSIGRGLRWQTMRRRFLHRCARRT